MFIIVGEINLKDMNRLFWLLQEIIMKITNCVEDQYSQ